VVLNRSSPSSNTIIMFSAALFNAVHLLLPSDACFTFTVIKFLITSILLIAFRFLFYVISFVSFFLYFQWFSFQFIVLHLIYSHFHLICKIADDFENHYIQINAKIYLYSSLLVFTSLTIFCVGCLASLYFIMFVLQLIQSTNCVFVHYIYYISW
jgi:hypothetical protein